MHNNMAMDSDNNIVVIGARMDGHAGVILDTCDAENKYKIIGFIDNTPEYQNTKINGIPVIGSTDDLEKLKLPTNNVHIAIGDNVARGKIFNRLKNIGLNVVSLIHPTATVSQKASIGEGCFIGPKAVINNGVEIKAATIINTGTIVEHDNKIGFAVHLAPGTKTTGRVHIDDFSFVGVGSTILPDIMIGAHTMIGAGSTVVKDVPPGTTVIGYAAKKHKKNIYVDARPDVGLTEKVYVAQPTLPDYPLLDEKFKDIAKSLLLSNFAKYSNNLELNVEKLLNVKKALTFPNGTSALMLGLKALNLTGEVILPSFTFSASGHAVVWNGLTPVFADIDPETFNIDPDDVERKITDKTSAIMAVHVFGNPVNISRLESIAQKHNLKLIFDSAHALGSQYQGKAIGGFGDMECFSLSGTKVITSAEGGLATTDNQELAEKLHLGRNYGAGPDYDCQYIGLNGKMSEFHAAIAIESLVLLGDFVEKRNKLVNLYTKRLSEIPGIIFQKVADDCISTYKDFAVIIDRKKFGMDRDRLIALLNDEGIYPKKYFYPIHRMKAYEKINFKAEGMRNTNYVADNIVCLPIFSHMTVDTVEKICYTVYRIWKSQVK
ncbi:NeuD/PglB/VioB family sugar acetyltransferase [Candidatus Margulisiibacteriota bacterium]